MSLNKLYTALRSAASQTAMARVDLKQATQGDGADQAEVPDLASRVFELEQEESSLRAKIAKLLESV